MDGLGRTRRRWADVSTIVLFLIAISASTLDSCIRDEAARGPAPELRSAAPRAPFPRSWETATTFPERFEAHFDDTFGLRDRLLRLNSLEKYFGLALSPTRMGLVGEDGWIYYAGDESMRIFRGELPFTEAELLAWQRELEGRAHMHTAGGRRYLFVLVPNKETIYPERLPDACRPIGPTRMDQFFTWMHEHSDVDVLDLRPRFLEEKRQDSGPMDALYSPHGTHWTGRGVYVAYATVVGHLAAGTSSAPPRPLADFDLVRSDLGLDSFAGNFYLLGILSQPGIKLLRRQPDTFTIVETSQASPTWTRSRGHEPGLLPHAIIFHDSFGSFIRDAFAQAFTICDMSEGPYDRDRILAGDTQIVVEMFVERYLHNHRPDPGAEPPLPERRETNHLLFDLTADPARAQPLPGLQVTPVESGGFRIVRSAARSGWVLGPLRAPAGGLVRARLVGEADAATLLEILWRQVDGPFFSRRNRLIVTLGPGRSEAEPVLALPPGEVELMLRPADADTAIVLRSFQVRSEQQP